MLGLLIVSIIAGAVVAGLTGIGFLFWVIAVPMFICGLPFALITGFVHDEVSYAQDRADYREEMRQIAEEEREIEREFYEYERMDRHLDRLDDISGYGSSTVNYNIDARSVHYHNSGAPKKTKKNCAIRTQKIRLPVLHKTNDQENILSDLSIFRQHFSLPTIS
jgi:hypothetical protein